MLLPVCFFVFFFFSVLFSFSFFEGEGGEVSNFGPGGRGGEGNR